MLYHDAYGKNFEPSAQDIIQWRVSGYVVIVEDGKLLAIKSTYRNPSLYCFPGGGIEPAESLAEGTMRECLEELGLEVKLEPQPWQTAESRFFLKDTFYHVISIYYKAVVVKPDLSKRLVEEEEAVWVDLKDLNKNNFFPYQYSIVEKLRE